MASWKHLVVMHLVKPDGVVYKEYANIVKGCYLLDVAFKRQGLAYNFMV